MTTPCGFARAWVSLLLTAAVGWMPVSAELPSLGKPPWLGHFAVLTDKHCHFSLNCQGKISLVPLGDKGDPVAKPLAIPIEIIIREILPDGETTVKKLKPESLTSTQSATDKLEKTVVRGKVTGDASFELTLESKRGLISLGGRLLDPGTLSKNPLRFSLQMKFPSAYPKEPKKDSKDAKETKNNARDFAKKISADHIDLQWSDGKRKKQTFENAVDASSKDLNGPGIATAEIEIAAYKGNKIVVSASPNSSLTLSNTKATPLHEGFVIHWLPDPAKDPEGKARFNIEVK